jgi:hypothetical protein
VAYFGSLLPNTFYAKTDGGLDQVGRGARYLGYFARDYLLPLLPLAAVLAALRMRCQIGARTEVDPAVRRERSFEMLLFGGVGLTFAPYVILVGGDYMPMYRFLVPILPGLGLLLIAFVHALDDGLPRSRGRRFAIGTAAALALVLTFYHSTPLERGRFGRPAVLEGTYRGVAFQRWNTARLSRIGRFFRTYRGSPEESIATRGVGAIAYFSELTVIDVLGVVDPHIARVDHHAGAHRPSLPGHAKRDWPYVLSREPTYLVLRSRLTPEPGLLRDLTGDMGPAEVEQVEREYRVVTRWVEDPAAGESGYFSFLERLDRAAAP